MWRLGAPAVCLSDAGGWNSLQSARFPDKLQGWLSSHERCGVIVDVSRNDLTVAQHAWVTVFLLRAQAQGLSLVWISRKLDLVRVPF